jgi:hypothetical protein
VPHAERDQRVDVLAGLRHPALVRRDDEQNGRRGPHPGEHRGDEPLVAGHVDERHRAGRQVGPGEPEVDGHAAPLLLGVAVGLHTGERPNERRLAVVDVPGRG